MAIEALTDRAIADVIDRYRRLGKSEGGPYSLAELLLEQRRRQPSVFPTVEVARAILDLGRQSADRLVTYKQIWAHFRPGEPWLGHSSQGHVRKALYRVIGYCVFNRLPIITVLVVRTGSRKLSEDAIQNIFNECRELGLDPGPDPHEFVKRETEWARRMHIEELPPERGG